MLERDTDRFTEILDGVFTTYGRERSDSAVALWWRLLQPYEFADVEEALAEHLRSSKFAPTPADIIGALAARDGRPSADEAWAMVPRDEAGSVCYTDEMAKAHGLAQPLLEAGDQVAARRAFMACYESEVSDARRTGKPINVWMSWGTDRHGRASALAKAVELGLMAPEKAKKFVPQLPMSETEAEAILGQLGAAAVKLKLIR